MPSPCPLVALPRGRTTDLSLMASPLPRPFSLSFGQEYKSHMFGGIRRKVAQILGVLREREIEQGMSSRDSKKAAKCERRPKLGETSL